MDDVGLDQWLHALSHIRAYTDATRKVLEQVCQHPAPYYRCEHCRLRFCLRCAKVVGVE